MAIQFFKNSELKGSTFRSRLINFSWRDISGDIFFQSLPQRPTPATRAYEVRTRNNQSLIYLYPSYNIIRDKGYTVYI